MVNLAVLNLADNRSYRLADHQLFCYCFTLACGPGRGATFTDWN